MLLLVNPIIMVMNVLETTLSKWLNYTDNTAKCLMFLGSVQYAISLCDLLASAWLPASFFEISSWPGVWQASGQRFCSSYLEMGAEISTQNISSVDQGEQWGYHNIILEI